MAAVVSQPHELFSIVASGNNQLMYAQFDEMFVILVDPGYQEIQGCWSHKEVQGAHRVAGGGK